MNEDCMLGPEVQARLGYRLLDAEQRVVEEGAGDEALEVLLGFAQLPAAVERALEGLRPGESTRVTLMPGEAFGARDAEQLLWVDRGELPATARVGDELEAEREDGSVVFLRVLELEAESACLDANHPLAGQPVTLELEVLSARPATRSELALAEEAVSVGPPAAGGLLPVEALLRSKTRQDTASER